MGFNPSKYQKKIFDFIRHGMGHAIVEAVAGSGKTTTIIKALDFIDSSMRVLFLAFNKSIAMELQERVPQNVKAATLNSFGWTICNQNAGKRITLDKDKTDKILRFRVFNQNDPVQVSNYKVSRVAIRRLISLAKAHNIQKPVDSDWKELADKYAVDYPTFTPNFDIDSFHAALNEAFSIGCNDLNVMDFDDQLFIPVLNGWRVPQYDFVFVDEAQDLNPVQMELVTRASTRGRVICVGDRHQSIYGFRGADTQAIPNLEKRLKATMLPLSISYRCPKSVVEEARRIVSHIEAFEGAILGTVTTEKETAFNKAAAEGDFVLCRTTAPLVMQAFRFLREGKRASVRGRDIGAQVRAMLDMICKQSTDQSVLAVTDALVAFRDRHVANLQAQEKEDEAIIMQDKCDTLLVFLGNAKTIAEAEGSINTMFTEGKDGIILSTIHKAKGLEARRVYVIRPELLPHPAARTPWAMDQEMNLKYVAITRAKSDLVWVETEVKK